MYGRRAKEEVNRNSRHDLKNGSERFNRINGELKKTFVVKYNTCQNKSHKALWLLDKTALIIPGDDTIQIESSLLSSHVTNDFQMTLFIKQKSYT
jgi:hypothetical protein